MVLRLASSMASAMKAYLTSDIIHAYKHLLNETSATQSAENRRKSVTDSGYAYVKQ